MKVLEHGPAGPIRHPEADGGLGGRQVGVGHEAVDQERQPGGGATLAGALEEFRGLSLRALVAKAGVSPGYLSEIELERSPDR